ncbi:MAG TPA: GNAT family N-acetyltransferase [Ktedonobacteraceae bacterium]|nr:GNAT family N-acetyltransferase [Ktedonobacteraceae bacterium]
MSTTTAASATYRCDLGEGLIKRWSTVEDTENIAQLCGKVFRDSEEEPFNPRAISRVYRMMREDFPFMGPGDYALVEDTRKAGNPIVACTCLWRRSWEYEGIPFGLGQPEFVATDPAYRNRGLIRALFEMVHARSEAEGHLAQAITGIPHFYRQFGYEYVLELEGRRLTYVSLIPKARDNAPDAYTLRAATANDIPRVMELYNQQRSGSKVWAVATERFWQYQTENVDNPLTSGKDLCVQVLTDQTGAVQGYLLVAARRHSSNLSVWALNIAPGVNWQAVVEPLLRSLQSYGMQIPVVQPEVGPLREISFVLGSTHPVYDALGQTLAPYFELPYAWYVRVPNVLAFLQHIAPALERHLADSTAAYYTGELKLDFYRRGVRMVFEKGRLAALEPWRAPLYKNTTDAQCPELVFLQLLFGYRSLDELRYAFPDIQVQSESAGLLKALFPLQHSWVMPLE